MTKFQLYALVLMAVIGFAVVGFLVYDFYYTHIYVGPTVWTYTTGLKAQFNVQDKTSAALLTSGLSPTVYPAGSDVLGYEVIPEPESVTIASYSNTMGAWFAVVDAGSYLTLLKESGTPATYYPETLDVSVAGSNEKDRATWFEPSTASLWQRATVTISPTIKANKTAGYDTTVTTLNYTTYDTWRVTYEFSVAGTNKIVKSGRLLVGEYTGLAVDGKAVVDGVETPVLTDKDATDDGMSGYWYVEFDEWEGGTIHRFDLYLKESGTPTAGTLTLTCYEYYACLNDDLRWWTDETKDITVEA